MSTITPTFSGFSEFLTPGRLSTAQYLRMIETGVLGSQDKVELIDGMIVQMSPQGTRHNHFLMQLNHLFVPLWDRAVVAIQATIVVAEGAVYDPDLLLLRQCVGGYKTRHPRAADVLLVVEASESSLPRDQKVKLPAYAQTGIPEYWIADLEHEVLLVHRDPQGSEYRLVETRRGSDRISPLAASDFSFAVREAFQ